MTDQTLLQFAPFKSAIDAAFWYLLTKKKLDVYKLDDSPVEIFGFYSNRGVAGVLPIANIDYSAFDECFEVPLYSFALRGKLVNTNTLEDFKKKDYVLLIQSSGEEIWKAIQNGKAVEDPSLLQSIICLTFADLKKYHYYYWIAFPVLNFPETEKCGQVKTMQQYFTTEQVTQVMTSYDTLSMADKIAFFVVVPEAGDVQLLRLKDFEHGTMKSGMNTITLQPSKQQREHQNFNKEVFVDFMAAQIKTLSFLAYIVRIYQEVVNEHSSQLAQGMIGLLRLCPQEVAHLRKELLIAARHILATDLREKFVVSLEELFDERILIGPGWTAYESLRPLAYSTLADLVHHVRTHLPLKDLSKAVTVFSKNVHDESLVTNIQTMSCKLLLNLVECIRGRSDRENGNGRELLMRMLEVFVLKFKTISKLQLPVLLAKARQQQQQYQGLPMAHLAALSHQIVPHAMPSASSSGQPPTAAADVKIEAKEVPATQSTATAATKGTIATGGGLLDNKEEKTKFGFPTSPASTYSVTDCKNLVKTLVCGVKTITWGITVCKIKVDNAYIQNKQFQPKETLVFIRLIKYALQALDIYSFPIPTPGLSQARPSPVQAVRSKEEKEVLEHLAGVYTMMHPLTFQEVFTTTIDYMVDRIYKNNSLQIVANSFLANRNTSPIFATILVEYLLKRMEEMGSNVDRSNLYLKLFKLVFGSVSLFPAENEQMLKPYLHQIVTRSMELALSAKEPYNYFLLLRALFRSIGGGSHDLLYQEFLPLLPNLLQGLNSLQSGLHKQHMKDLFVELCLTVPVRLSSLLPYLPMLMDPLVSALNGSQTLVSQGLRTLELCVVPINCFKI